MQTFLPYAEIEQCVKCLDWRRLGNQRNEGNIIYRTLRGFSSGWRNHPAVQMWENYEDFLAEYVNACITEWQRRGYKNTMSLLPVSNPIRPWWWNGRIHSSHRAALLAKNYDWYSQFNWVEEPKIEYYWPIEA